MNLNLRIINKRPELKTPEITFELWRLGIKIDRIQKYRLVKGAVKAGQRLARRLNVSIIMTTYYEPENNYEQRLVV